MDKYFLAIGSRYYALHAKMRNPAQYPGGVEQILGKCRNLFQAQNGAVMGPCHF